MIVENENESKDSLSKNEEASNAMEEEKKQDCIENIGLIQGTPKTMQQWGKEDNPDSGTFFKSLKSIEKVMNKTELSEEEVRTDKRRVTFDSNKDDSSIGLKTELKKRGSILKHEDFESFAFFYLTQ